MCHRVEKYATQCERGQALADLLDSIRLAKLPSFFMGGGQCSVKFVLSPPDEEVFSVNILPQSLPLTENDIYELLDLLTAELGNFFHFTGRDLYFPPAWSLHDPEYVAVEQTLLLPLVWQGRVVAALRLRGVGKKEFRRVQAKLPEITTLALESLSRARAAMLDASTGLYREEEIYSRIADSAGHIRDILARAPVAGDLGASSSLCHFCVGIVIVRLCSSRQIVEYGGYSFLERCLGRLASVLKKNLPKDALPARAGRCDFAVLLPSVSGRGACQKVANALLESMSKIELDDPRLPGHAGIYLSAGHALFPQDMRTLELRLSPYDQGRELLERARLAASMAAQKGAGTIMPFVRILQDGGVVLQTFGMGRLVINLGLQAKAREGLRFALHDGKTGRLKADVVLLQVGNREGIAEVVHLVDPACLPERGDTLALVDESSTLGAATDLGVAENVPRIHPSSMEAQGETGDNASRAPSVRGSEVVDSGKAKGRLEEKNGNNWNGGESAGNNFTGATLYCFGHGEFMHQYARVCEERDPFSLVLLRIDSGSVQDLPGGRTTLAQADGSVRENVMVAPEANSEVLARSLALWQPLAATVRSFAGFYGVNGLIFCHPGETSGLLERYQEFCRTLEENGIHAAIGLASWPLLQYGRGEMIECVLKALEYALLLPKPRVGICGSQAITISADRRYSQGDVFGAIEDYKLALLADPGNSLAWNSLGVSLAALGRYSEARRYFLRSLEQSKEASERAQANYNLGTVCQQLSEDGEATSYYKACLEDDSSYVYALVRLGQLAEKHGELDVALSYYEKAARSEHAAGRQGESSISLRCLARVAVRKCNKGEARRLLSEALRRNPDDAQAMLMLAELYLGEKGAADIAEILVHHSLSLVNQSRGWHVLARALRAQGRDDEAVQAELKA